MNVLIVCTGNTCRSPMAEGILKSFVSEADGINVLSGGVFANEGEKASANAVLALKQKGIDISKHTAKNINYDVVCEADLILTMTKSHKQMLINAFKDEAQKKTYTICEYVGIDKDVYDPYGGDIECYKECADFLYAALEDVYKKIRSDNE